MTDSFALMTSCGRGSGVFAPSPLRKTARAKDRLRSSSSRLTASREYTSRVELSRHISTEEHGASVVTGCASVVKGVKGVVVAETQKQQQQQHWVYS